MIAKSFFIYFDQISNTMYDIFYTHHKPYLFAHEQHTNSLADAKAKSKTSHFWFIDAHSTPSTFDFTWEPPVWESEQTHIFQCVSQFEKYEIRLVPKHAAQQVDHWYDPQYVEHRGNPDCWEKCVECTLPENWQPNPFEPPFIYVFGNQWHSPEVMPTAKYTVPAATETKYVHDVLATLPANKEHWSVPEEVDEATIDFSWVPDPGSPPYIYHFGTEHQMSVGLTYTVPGATEIRFEGEIPKVDKTASAIQVLDIFMVDMNNKSASARYEALLEHYPNAQKIRFMNGWIETIKRCATRAKTSKFWVISSENVYTNFDFSWHAEPWQTFMTHIFGSQWQKWSDTFLINKAEFNRHSRWAKKLEEFPNLHFVKDQHVYRPDDIYDIYFVDHTNPGSDEIFERIKTRYTDIKKARFVDNYLDTIKRIVSTAETEYVWVINSICDYAKFDFTWQPEPWQATMLHVFQSDDQKFGDTFYIHVPSFKEQMDKIALLEWFETTNFCADQVVPRLPLDVVEYNGDTVVDVVKDHTFKSQYAVFKPKGSATVKYTPSIWRKKDRSVHVFTKSGSVLVAPRDIKCVLREQIYDYPYITGHKDQFLDEKEMDIIYISNGEADAERWYEHLCRVCNGRTVKRVSGINGRSAAYKAAAALSDTPWFFAVFAKLEVDPAFDWSWQPDRMQDAKHYIFNATNPVNGLVYGHQAMIAYNKRLTLATETPGLDFTLSQKHEVVDMMSGIAHFNVDPWTTWRTSFRECIKLRDADDYDSVERLKIWMTVAEGDNAEWCLRGAHDAVEYYELVKGEHENLMLTFEWDWLRQYFDAKYKNYK